MDKLPLACYCFFNINSI